MTWINIPKNWTGDQALAVVEFLDEITAAVWNVHEIKMLDAWHEQNAANAVTDDDDEMLADAIYDIDPNTTSIDDDIPF